MRLFALLILFIVFGCSVKKSESITTIDSMKDQSIYFALPLGMTLDQYRAMYNLENYRSEIVQEGIDYIEYDCVVISTPTADELAEFEEESIDTNTKYMELVSKMIESGGVPTIRTTEQFINFKGDKGVWRLDLKKNSIPEWKVILFKVTKEPVVLLDVLVTKGEVDAYFEISENASP